MSAAAFLFPPVFCKACCRMLRSISGERLIVIEALIGKRERLESRPRQSARAFGGQGKVGGEEHLAIAAQSHGSFNGVLQLAHVPGPGICA